jgi:hypothetical protein
VASARTFTQTYRTFPVTPNKSSRSFSSDTRAMCAASLNERSSCSKPQTSVGTARHRERQ